MFSVPARLGKERGAEEIGRNLAREQPKFGHNPARERNEVWAQFSGRSMKTRAQTCMHFTVHQLSEYTEAETICIKRVLCKSGRAQGRAGRSTLINLPSWNTGVVPMIDYITDHRLVSSNDQALDYDVELSIISQNYVNKNCFN